MQPNRVTYDGQRNYRAWNEPPPLWSYTGPFANHQERITQQALTPMFMTSDEIASYVGNPLPQVAVFRPRRGYPTYTDRQFGISDIVTVTRLQPQQRSEWFSGGPAGIESGPRYMSNSLGSV
jgi:hypothetical protein